MGSQSLGWLSSPQRWLLLLRGQLWPPWGGVVGCGEAGPGGSPPPPGSGPSILQAAHFEVVAHGFSWTKEGGVGPEHTNGDRQGSTPFPPAVMRLSPRPGGHSQPASTPASHPDTPTDSGTSLAQPQLSLGISHPNALDGCPASCRGGHLGPRRLGWREPPVSTSQDQRWLLKPLIPSDLKQEEQSEGPNAGRPGQKHGACT